ncbi:MAG: homoserine O-acetyltransferase, partial [Actinomycetia bacterium]|nr:homoserine O-acetyltransferase [Actinomycetes bacterium]
MGPDGSGPVKTKYFTFAGPPDHLILESGAKLGPVTLAYETYGTLNARKDNAVLVLHALSGDAHAAGWHENDKKPGWWDNMIGPGKAFDTDRYFIISTNVLGGCKGSTGPSSTDPATGKPYGLGFPMITISDMVEAQKYLIDFLGIEKLLCAAGGSMGGMQVLQWAASYPGMVLSAIPIAAGLKHSPQQIAFNEVGRQAIMSDLEWKNGEYYGSASPKRGLAIARMIGHITYMSDTSMEQKFSRKLKNRNYNFSFQPDFEVEGYLHYKGDDFVKRFDANSYLYITKAIDYFDLSSNNTLVPKSREKNIRFMIISFKSDWLYPPYQSVEIVRKLKAGNVDVSYCDIDSSYGHDAFLIEIREETNLV